ncbi:hypothetical protein DL765_009741 [Monosporascus sp. GIB2]|nr:hypothetical protein DL765_009741 [Monosporascus sp. GIB2]
MLFGHLGLLNDFRRQHPPDVNIYVFHTWIRENFKRYFPDQDELPPVVYLDLWPFSGIFTLVYDAAAGAQFTQIHSLPKISFLTKYLIPLTQNLDILSTEGQSWKTWRTRLNPCFSQRNITALLPDLVDEVLVFVNGLKDVCGRNGEWGPVFQLEERTTDLALDVIAKATLDMKLNEQSRECGSELKHAFLEQMWFMGMMNQPIRGFLFGMLPWHRTKVARNNRIIDGSLKPQMQRKLNLGLDAQSGQALTIVDAAVESLAMNKSKPDSDFMALRDEHDLTLGTTVDDAPGILRKSPHVLNSLSYTLAVIKETLRLYPLASTMREGAAGFHLATTGSDIRWPTEGTGVWLSAHGLHSDPNYWTNPDEFLPERWIVAEGHPLRPLRDTWIPFSVGPRHCIGMELALTQLKLVAVLIVRSFDIEEAWEEWDLNRGNKATPHHIVNGQRLYPVGDGALPTKPIEAKTSKMWWSEISICVNIGSLFIVHLASQN